MKLSIKYILHFDEHKLIERENKVHILYNWGAWCKYKRTYDAYRLSYWQSLYDIKMSRTFMSYATFESLVFPVLYFNPFNIVSLLSITGK